MLILLIAVFWMTNRSGAGSQDNEAGLPRSRSVTVSNQSLVAWTERLVSYADRTVRAVDTASRAKLGLQVRTSSSASK